MQGRQLREADIQEIRELIAAHPGWSRRRISEELAQLWDWRGSSGQLKDMAARTLLLKMNRRGMIVLPERRWKSAPRRSLVLSDLLDNLPSPECVNESLKALRPLSLEVVVAGSETYGRFAGYLARHHYLSFRRLVGESIGYLAKDREGRDLACMLFGAAAWKTKPRDEWIGWDAATRARNLSLITNNTRFLILPWVRVPHLASHLLGSISRRVSADWQARYGHPIHLLETFVEKERFKGTCYRAANWICVGQTKGRSRQDRYTQMQVPIKDIWLHPLTPGYREELCHVEP
ncbi:MAG: Druantia anti-phage system protein DruA [Terriglobia bacterium]